MVAIFSGWGELTESLMGVVCFDDSASGAGIVTLTIA